jgi:hypothetical protein
MLYKLTSLKKTKIQNTEISKHWSKGEYPEVLKVIYILKSCLYFPYKQSIQPDLSLNVPLLNLLRLMKVYLPKVTYSKC